LSLEENDYLPTPTDFPELSNSTLYAMDGNEDQTIFDFEIKTVLGRGNYGKVFLVQKKST